MSPLYNPTSFNQQHNHTIKTMKKLRCKGTVHPSPSPSSPSNSNHLLPLAFLPTTVLALVVALSPSDKEVLAYLLSSSSTATPFDFEPSKTTLSSHKKHNNKHYPSNNYPHPTCFMCYCFTCYTTYWARWDSSPNRQLIHEIIDAFEDHLLTPRKKKNGVNKKRKNVPKKCSETKSEGLVRVNHLESGRIGSVVEDVGDETGEKQGTVRKMASFIWGSVWG